MRRTTGPASSTGATSRPFRRWTWGVAAVLAGAAAGVAAALAVRRLPGADRPDAVAPEQLRAVVDRAEGEADSRG